MMKIIRVAHKTDLSGPKPLKADLHLHTAEDPNDRVPYTAKELISKAADDGFDVLSITNHHQMTFNQRLFSYARERGILLIPGVEIDIRFRHVLLLNPPGGKTVSDFSSLSSLRRPDSLIVAPHPYFPNPHSLNGCLLKNLRHFDALEYCHFYSPRINFNQRAIALSKSRGIPLIGNSDSHFLSQFGTTYSLIYAEKDPEAIFSAIRGSRLEIITRPLSHIEMGTLLGRFFGMKLPGKKMRHRKTKETRIATRHPRLGHINITALNYDVPSCQGAWAQTKRA